MKKGSIVVLIKEYSEPVKAWFKQYKVPLPVTNEYYELSEDPIRISSPRPLGGIMLVEFKPNVPDGYYYNMADFREVQKVGDIDLTTIGEAKEMPENTSEWGKILTKPN